MAKTEKHKRRVRQVANPRLRRQAVAPPRPRTAVAAEAAAAAGSAPPIGGRVDPGFPNTWKPALRRARAAELKARDRQRQLVRQALASGSTFTEVAAELGMTRQAAWQRFGRAVES